MKKRLLSAFLCAAMLATMIPAAFASDLDGHWSKNFIEYLDDEGIINPSATTGKYEPERKVTRAEFMRYVNRAFHFTEKASISYSDVQSNSWYYDTVRIADGPLTSFTGVVEALDPEKNKVRVAVSMFGRETPVELELDQAELL